MALDSEILVTNYGIPSQFAENLLDYTHKDVEGAIRILEAAEKDIVALKIKFISSKKMTNGAIVFFYNFQSNIPEYIFCVVSSDQALGRIKLENGWKEFLDEMIKFMSASDSDPDSSSRIESQILTPENVKYITSFFIDKNNFDMVNIKRFILSEISKILMDTGIVIKIVPEDIDLFRFKTFFNETKLGLKVLSQNAINSIMLINMKIEPLLTPIGGIDVERIAPGDQVLAKIIDGREVVNYIRELCTTRDEANKSIYGRVVRNLKSPASENLIITLEFGPGIFGTFIMGGKIKIQVIHGDKKENKPVGDQIEIKKEDLPANTVTLDNLYPPQDEEKKPHKKANVLLIVLIILIGAVIVGMVAVMFFGG